MRGTCHLGVTAAAPARASRLPKPEVDVRHTCGSAACTVVHLAAAPPEHAHTCVCPRSLATRVCAPPSGAAGDSSLRGQ